MAKFVIAEDDSVFRFLVCKLIERNNHKILAEVKTVNDAIEKILLLNPEFVLMDISMENRYDGIFACKEIKNKSPWIKIIFMTAFPKHVIEDKLKEINYDGYFEKPIDEDKLISFINSKL